MSVSGPAKLHLTYILPQLKTTLLRQAIQIRQIGETYISLSMFYCVMFFGQDMHG